MRHETKSKYRLGIQKYLLTAALGVTAFASGLTGTAEAHDSLGPTMFTVDRGAVNSFTTPTSVLLSSPWVRKYFATAGQCLSIDVFQVVPFADLELVVISPDPSIRYRDDDSSASCGNCPIVKIDPAPVTGYYTVIANHWAGSPVTVDFLASIARQSSGSSACTSPTPAF